MDNNTLDIILEELIALPAESEWVEFKLNKGSITNEQIGEYVSAMSNGATIRNKPFGYVVWGIDDNTHKVVGTNFTFVNAKQGNQDLELWLRNLLYPRISFEIYEFEYRDVHVVLLRIPAAKGEPINFQKKPYIRIGSNKTDLRNFPDYMRMIYNSQEDWSAKIVANASFHDLDTAAIAVARQKYREKNIHETFYKYIDGWSDEVLLDKMKITKDGKITNTALILLGKPESSHNMLPFVAQITWKLDTEEKAYQHFGMPLFVEVNNVLAKIRNVLYKFFPDNRLVSVEVPKYDPEVILEAMNNCIAHQDYWRHGRIVVTEKINKLIFENCGGFYEGTAEDYSFGEKTPQNYRNRWLVEAMVNLGMIDSLGYGIHKMVNSQRNRYFPLPDYSKSTADEVVLEIYGHAIDENYSKLLIEKNDELTLTEVVLLDKVQKKQPINDEAAKLLRNKKLVEGRKPNFFVASHIAKITGHKADYIKNRGFKDEHYKQMIVNFISQYGQASKQDVDKLILDILPDILDKQQRENKVRNLLYALHKRDKLIVNQGTNRNPKWILSLSNQKEIR
jgi:ATP-dependent DNA helicase RecG